MAKPKSTTKTTKSTSSAPESVEPKSTKQKYSILESVGAIVAVSGLLAALAWFLGRTYYLGRDSAYGLSISSGNITDYDFTSYGSVFVLATLLLSGFFILIYSNAQSFATFLLFKPFQYLERKFFRQVNPERGRNAAYIILMFVLFILGILCLLFILSDLLSLVRIVYGYVAGVLVYLMFLELERNRSRLHSLFFTWDHVFIPIFPIVGLYFFFVLYVGSLGYQDGCQDVVLKEDVFTIYSTQPLPLENSNIPAQNNIFEYNDYYGFLGNEYIILYKDFDANRYTPREVYYLRKSNVYSFSITIKTATDAEKKSAAVLCKAAALKRFQILFPS